MRLTLLTTLVAFSAIACGSEKKPATAQAEAATPATPSPAPATTAAAHDETAESLIAVKTRTDLRTAPA